MSSIERTQSFAVALVRVEQLFYDVERWPAWVDGFARVVEQAGVWPEVGARVEWESTPHGRGRVLERAQEYEPGRGSTTLFEDDRLEGTQNVAFTSGDEGIELSVSLEWRLKGAGIGGRFVDLVFVRKAMGDSLDRTLDAFRRELSEPG